MKLTDIQIVVAIARQVQHLLTDPRLIAALTVAEHHENGAATDEELIAAWTLPLESTRDLARAAAAWAALWAARAAAGDGAGADAWDGAWDGERQTQTAEFLRIVGGE